MRTLTLEEMVEMKLGTHFVDRHGDYAIYLQCLMTHLVYFILCFLSFYSIFVTLTFSIPIL